MDNLLELGDDSGGRARMLIRALDKVLRTVPADTVELSERADQAELVLAELGLWESTERTFCVTGWHREQHCRS